MQNTEVELSSDTRTAEITVKTAATNQMIKMTFLTLLGVMRCVKGYKTRFSRSIAIVDKVKAFSTQTVRATVLPVLQTNSTENRTSKR